MMKPIYEFKTIQIELTNACVHSCSNCTRFCGHHKKPFYMEWDTFKNAVDTLEDWPRLIGVMGGEPTLHPQFERFASYAYEKHPMQYEIGGGAHPTKSLSKYVIDANAIKTGPLNKFRGLGLWSTVSNKYYQHYELIQDKFVFQCINDHTASSRHQPWLMTRKEFGIPDDEWETMRNNCWWHRTLNSPSITPKGAFFCEVAAAMDILFDGPGGWKVEKDWWKRDFDDYKDQLHWCELCCGAFITFDRDANEEVDDVSPLMYEKLIEMGSPKAKKDGGVIVHEIGKDGKLKTKPRKNMLLYQDNDELRFTSLNKCLYPNRIHGVVWSRSGKVQTDYVDKLKNLFDAVSVINASDKEAFVALAKLIRDEKDWIAIIPDDWDVEVDFRNKLSEVIFNPGTFHIFTYNKIMMFNVRARSLKSSGFSAVSNLENIDELSALWSCDKVSYLDKDYDMIEGADLESWIETLTKKGIIEFNYILPHIEDMILRRRVEPGINEIMSSVATIEQKLMLLDGVYHKSISYQKLVNKVKTTIHNALAAELKCTSVEELVNKLTEKRESFCVNYALAMLSVGSDKEKYLVDCVANEKNKYLLGLEALKRHCDFFAASKNKNSPQLCGTILEILNVSPEQNEICLAGNRYNGKSISMILSHANKKAKFFVDDDRVGSYFDELPTLSVSDYTKEYSQVTVVMTQNGDGFEETTMLCLEKYGYCDKPLKLHPLTYREMAMSCNIYDLGISAKSIEDIKELWGEQERVAKCKELLEK